MSEKSKEEIILGNKDYKSIGFYLQYPAFGVSRPATKYSTVFLDATADNNKNEILGCK